MITQVLDTLIKKCIICEPTVSVYDHFLLSSREFTAVLQITKIERETNYAKEIPKKPKILKDSWRLTQLAFQFILNF